MALPFEFVIDGPPISQQARRREKVRQWRDEVRKLAAQYWPAGEQPVAGPIMLTITSFYDSASIDVDNIPKPISDALKGLVYEDDKQVTDVLTMTSLEKHRTSVIAEEHRSRGYAVIEYPSAEQLPDFLSSYHPNLLIRKGDDAIVVKVKSRSSLTKDSEIRDLKPLTSTLFS